jgi:hypothetical protein
MKLAPELAGTMDLLVLMPYPLDFHSEGGVSFGAWWKSRGIDLTGLLRSAR